MCARPVLITMVTDGSGPVTVRLYQVLNLEVMLRGDLHVPGVTMGCLVCCLCMILRASVAQALRIK